MSYLVLKRWWWGDSQQQYSITASGNIKDNKNTHSNEIDHSSPIPGENSTKMVAVNRL